MALKEHLMVNLKEIRTIILSSGKHFKKCRHCMDVFPLWKILVQVWILESLLGSGLTLDVLVPTTLFDDLVSLPSFSPTKSHPLIYAFCPPLP